MITLGLTGGIGMGKSTAAGLLAGLNVPVIDTDCLARELVEPGQPALEEIGRVFGTELIGPDGRLLRDDLGKRVFQDENARKRLESILHPQIRQAWLAQVQAWRTENRRVCAVVVPLLFEIGAEHEFDATICVACSAKTQLERLRSRGWTDDQIRQRIEAQLPTKTKMERSTYVVWSEGALPAHLDQLRKILGDLGVS